MESYLFYSMIGKEKRPTIHICLESLDCLRICASLGIFKSQMLLFVSASSFFLYLTGNQFLPHLLLKQNNGIIMAKHFAKQWVTHNGNCCEVFLQFRCSQVVKNSFYLRFSIFLLCIYSYFKKRCRKKSRKRLSQDRMVIWDFYNDLLQVLGEVLRSLK